MFASLPLSQLIPIFITAGAAIWFAGIQLTNTTDAIDSRFNLGEALGGLILLAFTTNLPEIAIVTSAAFTHNMGLAIGNILGGIAIQTVVLVILDGFGLGAKAPLTYTAGSLQLVLEGVLVICVLVISIMGSQLTQSAIMFNIAPCDLLIAGSWLFGLWMINKARTRLPWRDKKSSHKCARPKHQRHKKITSKWSNARVFFIFTLAALVTLAAGVVLEETSTTIASHIGWSGILFGSTILAFITSLPEISTGLAAVKIGDYSLAISDIFGGNAFLPVLFLPATILSGESVLPLATKADTYLACLGILLTAIYICGLIFRHKRQFFYLGIDSIVVLITYIIGIVGLFMIS